MSARTRFFVGSANGRTHRSAPTRGGEVFRRQRELVQNRGLAGRDGARPLQGNRGRTAAGCARGVASASQIPKWNLGRQSRSSRPTEDGGAGRWVVGPYGWLRKVLSTALGRSPPPKPLCGQADSGERNRSQQRNGNFRPSSSVPGLLQEGGCGPLLGFRRSRRKKAGSFFAAACTRRKILLTERRVKGTQPLGAGSLLHQSEVQSPSSCAGGALCHRAATRHGASLTGMFLGTFRRNFIFSP